MSGAVQSCKEVTVTDAKWQNVDKISIACSSVGSYVYIKLNIENFRRGYKIKVNIVDYNEKTVLRENIPVTVVKERNSNSIIAISEKIEVEEKWLFMELAIVVPEFIYEEDTICKTCETKHTAFTSSKLSIVADYLDVRIKVLDVRSNKPVANAVVKSVKIIDKSGNTELLKTEFDHKETKLDPISKSNRKKLTINALKSLLNKTDKEVNLSNDKWKKAYKEYWNARIPDIESKEDIFKDNILDLIIRDYNDQVATDNNGILTIHIPSALLKDKSAHIEIGFWNFPIVKESIVKRKGFHRDIDGKTQEAKNTPFIVSWGNGTQSTKWGGNFNWIASSPRQNSKEDGNNRAELKVSESLIIKDSAEEIFSIKPNLRSFLYTKDGDPHFILFAMQWCQPIWDDIEDPDPDIEPSRRSNENTFINMKHDRSWVRGLHMHIPSKHTGDSGPYYGIFDIITPYPRGQRPHYGVDLYSGPNGDLPVFALHAGEIKPHASAGGYGYQAFLLFGGIGEPSFRYAHLASATTAKEWAMAGEIIGTAGLTKSVKNNTVEYYNEPYHLHLEFIKSPTTLPPTMPSETRLVFSDVNTIPNPPTGPNAFLFQGNKLPLLLPCKSVYCDHPNASYKKSCILDGDGTVNEKRYTTCFAVKKYPYKNNLLLSNITDMVSTDLNTAAGLIRYICPHLISENSPKTVQLQAKIKYLHINKNQGLFSYDSANLATFNSLFTDKDEFNIDGSTGPDTISAIKELIIAYYYCEKDEILNANKADIDVTHIQAFINKYINETEISDKTDYAIIRDFDEWFDGLDFNNMCW